MGFFLAFRLDYGMTNTERLYEYISARTYGEHHGNCEAAYPQCPFSVFALMDHQDFHEMNAMYPDALNNQYHNVP